MSPSTAIRRVPECTHRPPCPGCPRYGEPGINATACDALLQLASETGAQLEPCIEGDPLGYRHRARLMVRGRAGSPKIGLFQARSHRIVDTPHCQVHHPLLNEAAAALKRAIRRTGAAPYADVPHRGLVRAMQGVVERSTQTLQLVVVTNSDAPTPARALLEAVRDELGDRLHSLWWNGNSRRQNAILGASWERLHGPEAVRENIAGADVFFPPGAFGQSHLELADELVHRVHASVPENRRVAEFYAGCGAIGLGLLARGCAVSFNEVAPAGLRGLELGIGALPSSTRHHASLVAGPAGDHASVLENCDIAIIDPPRKGLDAPLRDRLSGDPPERLVYVACDLESFERDVRTLLMGERLRLRTLTPFALFPFTDHVEILAILDRI